MRPTRRGERVACPVCRADTRPEPFHYLWHGERRLRRCSGCTHQFIYPHLTDAERDAIFADPYFQRGGDIFDGAWTGGYEDEAENLREESAEILGLLPAGPGRILDIGCAGGVFLETAAKAGWDVTGIELNPTMADRARERGARVIIGSATSVDPDTFTTPFDVVVLLDVLEHIPRPAAVLERIERWTRPGGMLLIRGPMNNDRGAMVRESVRRVLRMDKRLAGYPLDANIFSQRSLTALVSAWGFRVDAWPGLQKDFGHMIAVRQAARS